MIELKEVETALDDDVFFKKWFASLKDDVMKDFIYLSLVRQAENIQ